MRLIGYCTECHRVKPVRVTGNALALAGRGVVQGTCTSCEDKTNARRKGKK